MKVIFRTDGNRDMGMGHVIRCLALADELNRHKDFSGIFFLTRYEESIRIIREKGYQAIASRDDDISQINDLASRETLLVTDFLDTDNSYLGEIRKIRNLKLIAIDNNTKLKQLDAGIVINANVFHAETTGVIGATSYYLGPEYMILNSRFGEARKAGKEIKDGVSNILVMSGGADSPNGQLTLNSIKALEKIGEETQIHVIIGPAFAYRNQLSEVLSRTPGHFNVYFNPPNLVEIMQSADMAITAAGITLFELATLGIPLVVVPQVTPGMYHQLYLAEVFERYGACLNLGKTRDSELILAKATMLMQDKSLRESLSRKAQALVDGRGLERVLGVIREICGLTGVN